MMINIPNSMLKTAGLALLGAAILVGFVGSVYAINRNHHNDKVDFGAASVNESDAISTNQLDKTTTDNQPTPSTPSQKPTQPVTASSAPSVDTNALNAKLCKNLVDSAKGMSASYNKMFFDGWNSWNTTYAGDYTSQAALDSKQSSKDYIKGLYSSFISTNNPAYIQDCGSGPGSIADVMVQPNYDAWQ